MADGQKAGPFEQLAVVEDEPGAGGQIAIQALKGAATDGSVYGGFLIRIQGNMAHTLKPVVVINVVGLTPRLLGPSTPHLSRLARGIGMRSLVPAFPAVTCTAQSTMLTGLDPAGHGIVGNGWYFRDLGEVLFWRQSSRLVAGTKVWEVARQRDPAFTCANLFWWYAMHTTADISVTPRPIYLADGRKLPECYAAPPGLAEELTRRLGTFPLFRFWGPATTIESSRWIAEAALHVRRTRKPTLTLVYLPHLDYDLQRLGPSHPAIRKAVSEVDALCGMLIDEASSGGADVLVVSEYGITAVNRPVHLNRVLRRAGLLAVREEVGREQLDPSASMAFAVADHQAAHVYVRDEARVGEVAGLLAAEPGVEAVLDRAGQAGAGIAHERSGDLVVVASPESWFTWYHWLDDARAPDFARTVEIHRKTGYDPVELFLDPALRLPKVAIGLRLARRALGFRTLMDVIPLDATLVKGSHGRPPDDSADGPLVIGADPACLPAGNSAVPMSAVNRIILHHLFGEGRA